jgi:hypothetical protein
MPPSSLAVQEASPQEEEVQPQAEAEALLVEVEARPMAVAVLLLVGVVHPAATSACPLVEACHPAEEVNQVGQDHRLDQEQRLAEALVVAVCPQVAFCSGDHPSMGLAVVVLVLVVSYPKVRLVGAHAQEEHQRVGCAATSCRRRSAPTALS